MKKFVLFCLAASLSTTANAQTAADQVAGLKAAQIEQVDAGFFARGNVGILVQADGAIAPYVPFDTGLIPNTIKAIRVAGVFSGKHMGLHYLYIDGRFGAQHIQRDAGGSGGGAEKEDAATLDLLVGQPLTQQLATAGFKAVGAKNLVWHREVNGRPVIITVENEIITGVYKPAERLESKLKGAVVIGYSDLKDSYGAVNSAVRVQNAFTKFDIVAEYSGRIANVEFFKDLKEVELIDLGLKLPAVKKDAESDFRIGAMNPTELILKLIGLGGASVDKIETDARKVDGCSSGDKLLANGESLVKVIADDNDKVLKLGLTHQQIAKPLLYAQAILDGSYGDQFKLHGIDYKVSGGASPMCGQLKSPFNDGYSTSISFLRITNLKTSKTVNYSKLHPYLINQYGFYGSHQNRSYVSPDSIADVFEHLRK